MKEKLVFSSVDNVEIEYICSVLKENDITFIKETEGAGEYLTIAGGNFFKNTTKIYVSEEDFEKASELIKVISSEENEDKEEVDVPEELKDISSEEEKEMEEKAEETKGYLRKFVMFFIILPFVIVVALAIIMGMIK